MHLVCCDTVDFRHWETQTRRKPWVHTTLSLVPTFFAGRTLFLEHKSRGCEISNSLLKTAHCRKGMAQTNGVVRRPKSIYQHRAKGSPTNTLKPLWCICIFLLFSLANKLFGIHQTCFVPVEALEFSELKTPLVYTLFSLQAVNF